MSLDEMLALLRDAALLDKCVSVQQATTFFVKVNLDDELYEAITGKESEIDSSAGLTLEEFLEVKSIYGFEASN